MSFNIAVERDDELLEKAEKILEEDECTVEEAIARFLEHIVRKSGHGYISSSYQLVHLQ